MEFARLPSWSELSNDWQAISARLAMVLSEFLTTPSRIYANLPKLARINDLAYTVRHVLGRIQADCRASPMREVVRDTRGARCHRRD